jgi:xylulokinase
VTVAQYLGLDSSTQSLTGILIDTDQGEVVIDRSVNFGQTLPHYRSPNGFLPNPDPTIKHSDPLMWVEALDLLLGQLRDAGVDLGRVCGISGAGQQHGSVYLNRSLRGAGGWSTREPLREQLRPLLSRPTAPIWMDSATSAECAEIAASLGGDQAVVGITGSRPTERFTGPQIRKFFQDSPEAWQNTREIHLVSSFMASLLIGANAAIDHGDGAGMNLLDLATGDWSERMLDATAPGLREKLPRPVPSMTEVGTVAEYFVERYGFARGTPVIAFTGDNPSSLVGMGATRPGTAVVSLGTSDTVFAAMARPHTDPRGYGHVFGNPAGGFMSLICFSNGSLAREEIARRFGLGWADFARAIVQETLPGNGGCLMLPYFVPEITPKLLKPELRLFGCDAFTAERDARAAARAIVEAQALSMKLHSDWIGQSLDTILVTGGASRNPGILRVLADVFQAELLPLRVANASALGGALRAAQAVGGLGWDELYSRFAAPDAELRTRPNPETRGIYRDLGAEFQLRLADLLAAQN